MLSLTVNTSSSFGSLVLGSKDRVLAELNWHKEKSHSEKITVLLQELLDQTGHSLKDLELIICGHGPGSFTGLRVALSVVKTLSYSLDIPIIAVDDCLALALNALQMQDSQPICVLIDAQKNKFFAGLYQKKENHLSTLLKPSLVNFDELYQQLKNDKYICIGDGFEAYKSFLPAPLIKKLDRSNSLSDQPHSRIIFEYVTKFPSHFQKISWQDLSALYLRASAAEEVLADKISSKK